MSEGNPIGVNISDTSLLTGNFSSGDHPTTTPSEPLHPAGHTGVNTTDSPTLYLIVGFLIGLTLAIWS